MEEKRVPARMLSIAAAIACVVLQCLVLQCLVLQCTALAAETPPTAYQIGAEDVITVLVARHPEFSGDFYVPADGAVDLPPVGRTQLGAKTLTQISDQLKAQLSKRVRDPEVSVTLRSPRMQRIYVLGVVEKPGLYDLKSGWRITEAMAATGGLAAGIEPSDCTVTLLRFATGARQSVSLIDVMRGAKDANMAISSGDVLTIEAQETLPVYVMGKVRSPGFYRLRKDSPGLIEALTLAGGALDEAALTHVTITHLNGTSSTVDLTPEIVQGKQGSNMKLTTGDLVVVPEETSKVAILGYVNQPGYYPLRNGQKLLLMDALGLAKGVDNKQGSMGAVAVIRNEGQTLKRTVYDLRKFLRSGDMAYNPEVKPADVIYVPQTNKPDWDIIMRSLTTAAIVANPFMP